MDVHPSRKIHVGLATVKSMLKLPSPVKIMECSVVHNDQGAFLELDCVGLEEGTWAPQYKQTKTGEVMFEGFKKA